MVAPRLLISAMRVSERVTYTGYLGITDLTGAINFVITCLYSVHRVRKSLRLKIVNRVFSVSHSEFGISCRLTRYSHVLPLLIKISEEFIVPCCIYTETATLWLWNALLFMGAGIVRVVTVSFCSTGWANSITSQKLSVCVCVSVC